MKKNWRFVYQDNQYFGECLPCTLAVFGWGDVPIADRRREALTVDSVIEGVAALLHLCCLGVRPCARDRQDG